jgi:hypothetical protein
MLKEGKDSGALREGRPVTVVSGDSFSLARAGISRDLSSRAQAIANIPAEQFEQTLAEHREEQQAVTGRTMEKPLVSAEGLSRTGVRRAGRRALGRVRLRRRGPHQRWLKARGASLVRFALGHFTCDLGFNLGAPASACGDEHGTARFGVGLIPIRPARRAPRSRLGRLRMGWGVQNLGDIRERVCDALAELGGLFLVVFVDELREGAHGFLNAV